MDVEGKGLVTREQWMGYMRAQCELHSGRGAGEGELFLTNLMTTLREGCEYMAQEKASYSAYLAGTPAEPAFPSYRPWQT
jgi:hypothetical protein